MTWVKFRDTVLPTAEGIEIKPPASGGYTTYLTATNPEAPPVIQWDSEEQRNPVSWYFWHGGSTAGQFGLRSGVWTEVVALSYKPPMWFNPDKFAHQGKGVLFVIKGARDSREPHVCLFPEIMKSEFHGVRSVIESFSASKMLDPVPDGQLAAGFSFDQGDRGQRTFVRVKSKGRWQEYTLDRWD
jgi:hypothetical protein